MDLHKDTENLIDEASNNETEIVSKKTHHRKMSKLAKVILAISLTVFVCSSAIIIHNYLKRKNTVDINSELYSIFFTEENGEEKLNFEEMRAINPGFVGWIKVPNTNISLPVAKYVDNSFYLSHDFYKKYDQRGTVFMDCHNDPVNLDPNTILYGHNCYDGTMFSDLEKYQDIEFYKSSPVIEFTTEKGTLKWKVYAVFITTAKAEEDNGYVFNYIYPDMSGENFTGFINEVNKRRLYETNVDITDGDNMLVLSTCVRNLDTYSNGKTSYRADGRLVVLARLLREGESADVNLDGITLNPAPKYPQQWYDKYNKSNPYESDEKWYPQEEVN